MVFAQKAAAVLLVAASVDGFRVKPKKRQAKEKAAAQEQLAAREEVAVKVSEEPVFQSEMEEEIVKRFVDASIQMGKAEPKPGLDIGSLPTCSLSESSCNIGSMTGPTVVYTGSSNSKCLNGDPFAFVVKPGRLDKLLLYFPGGGACWKGTLTNGELCTQSLKDGLDNAGLGAGVTDGRAENKFRDFTFVAPSYCDGGAFVTNSSLKGKPQNGFTNTNFAVEWAKSNLNSKLSSFTIAGSSAGALGTMAWSNYLLRHFRYNKAAVIVDSYMAVFPPGTQGTTIKNFGACGTPMFAEFRQECEAATVTIQDVFDLAIKSHPSVAFSMIQPKGDLVQIAFYAAIAVTYGKLDVVLANSLYQRANDIKQRFDKYPNFVNFIVDGRGHTYLAGDKYWSATVTGDSGSKGNGGKPTMASWINSLIDHESMQSACNGPLQKNGGNAWLIKNTKYCFDQIFPKMLSVR